MIFLEQSALGEITHRLMILDQARQHAVINLTGTIHTGKMEGNFFNAFRYTRESGRSNTGRVYNLYHYKLLSYRLLEYSPGIDSTVSKVPVLGS